MHGTIGIALRALVLLGVAACAGPRTLHRSEFGNGIECDVPGGSVGAWQLALVPGDLSALRAELTLDSSHPDEEWLPVVFLMLDAGRETDAVRVELVKAESSPRLELRARVLEQGTPFWRAALERDVAEGTTREVSIDWSRSGQVEVRVGEAPPVFVPLHFEVARVLAGCSSASARVWLPAP